MVQRLSGVVWVEVTIALLGVYVALLVASYIGGEIVPGRLLSDPADIAVYYERAQFYVRGVTPYRDAFSEYPLLATLAFAVPFLASPGLQPDQYALLWAFLMAIAFLETVVVVAGARRALGLTAWPVVLLASPTLLYFSLMRFDILVALLVCVAMGRFLHGRSLLASVLLGLGVHLKWFPAVIFLVLLAYEFRRDLASGPSGADWLRSRSVQCAAAFLLPALGIVAVSVLAFSWEGFLVPYQFHAARGSQYANAYWITERIFGSEGKLPAIADLAFLAAQFSILGVLAWRPPGSRHEVLQYSVLATVLFITFAKVDSPQWVLWYAPLVLMFARRAPTLVAFVVLATLNYLVFPFGFDHAAPAPESTGFAVLVLAKDLALMGVLAAVLWERPSKQACAVGVA